MGNPSESGYYWVWESDTHPADVMYWDAGNGSWYGLDETLGNLKAFCIPTVHAWSGPLIPPPMPGPER